MSDDKSHNARSESLSFESQLSNGEQRFLAHAIEHAFTVGRRSPEDFVRHFPPAVMMEGMASQPQLRANILVQTTGLKEKIALKKSWSSAAEDLDIALKEGETDARTVVSVFHPDDRVRYLDAKALWLFLIEGNFWLAEAGKKAYGPAKEHVAFLIERALKDKLVTHRDVVDGISVAELATRLPKAELGKIIEGALTAGQKSSPFTEVELLGAMPPGVLVDYVPLQHLWDSVVAPRVATAHGYSEAGGTAQAVVHTADAVDEKAGDVLAGKAKRAAAGTRKQARADSETEPVEWVDAVDEDTSLITEDELSDDDFA